MTGRNGNRQGGQRRGVTDPAYYGAVPSNNHPDDRQRTSDSFASSEEEMLMRKFLKEPETPDVNIVINGATVRIPKYNGVGWWFPRAQSTPWAKFFYVFFTVVNATQTFSFAFIPIVLFCRFYWGYVLLSFPLIVPLGSHLEESYGANYGTAYTSFVTLYLTFLLLGLYVANREASFDPNQIIFAGAFMCLLFLVGNGLCMIEKNVLGRTWFAAVLAYGLLYNWVSQVFSLVVGSGGI